MINKKLIEVALPLDKINTEAGREKSIRHGHPSTLHLWWARRPLAATRAVIWASLVDDPSAHPEKFPTEEDQNKERQRLFKILEDLVVWENSNNEDVLNAAKAEILKSTDNNPPALLDPFAGGGAIPLEAQRLGLEAHAHDLNPVAVMINRSMIDIPARFSGKAPVNPSINKMLNGATWERTSGLIEDIKYYGNRLKDDVFKKIGFLYPQVDIPLNEGGGQGTVIAWIWARTIKCPNPMCGRSVPLMKTFWLSKSKGKEAYATLEWNDEKFHFNIHSGKPDKNATDIVNAGTKYRRGSKSLKGNFFCPCCEAGIRGDYIDEEAAAGSMDIYPVAVVAESKSGRKYLAVDDIQSEIMLSEVKKYYESNKIAEQVPSEACYGTGGSNARGRRYSFFEFRDYFTQRQQICLCSLSEQITEVRKEIIADALKKGKKEDYISLEDGGTGITAYADAVSTYLAFMVDKLADANSSLVSWNVSRDGLRNTFARQAYPMTWDFAEANPFSSSSGCIDNCFDWITKALQLMPSGIPGEVGQYDAQSDCGLRNVIVSTDPPYYDNIGYADLSDFFYVWMRKSLKNIYPKSFSTLLVPKREELVAIPYRFNGNKQIAHTFFENGMFKACQQIAKYVDEKYPVTIYYAYKQNDTKENESVAVSSGWETMLSAIINAGLQITGTWPLSTERESRSVGIGTNALASSIVLVCRKRSEEAKQTTRRNLVSQLRRELRPALQKLQDSNIAPVDLAQSSIGPGMSVFSRYRRVLEADGTAMSVRSALQVINEEVDLYFNEQVGSMDTASRFCIDLYTQCAYNDIKYGEAEVLANAKGTSIPMMAVHGMLFAKAGVVHLVERESLPEKIDSNESNIWMLTQQLTRAMANGGVEACANIVFNMFGSNAENAKDLAYRLYTIAERKGWANEAYAYNALVVAWPDIQTRAAELKAVQPKQLSLFDF